MRKHCSILSCLELILKRFSSPVLLMSPKGSCGHDTQNKGGEKLRTSNFQLPQSPCGHDTQSKGLEKFKKSFSQLPKGPCGHDPQKKGLEKFKKRLLDDPLEQVLGGHGLGKPHLAYCDKLFVLGFEGSLFLWLVPHGNNLTPDGIIIPPPLGSGGDRRLLSDFPASFYKFPEVSPGYSQFFSKVVHLFLGFNVLPGFTPFIVIGRSCYGSVSFTDRLANFERMEGVV